ncbi:magnesium transporter [Peptostreptococcus equinus]|uniref:Magnesium transporter MgtE n=1 Tax=Peptostreptococcus equinus TaxID=3003601 RepID=A0ABY7JNY0_9FIRM|nr:magnesium transporter [Peptostreptococcus sp. CBA3647]WAW14176.1 magnesium transporter [Peptostreptococcus sp. CBA3647]
MDKKQDSARELYDQVKEMMDNNKFIELRETLDEYHTMDIYDVLQDLDEVDRLKLFEILPLESAASILEECESEFFQNIVANIDREHLRNIFEEMSMGDLADILRELDEGSREKILDIVSKEDEEELRELLAYVDETSGSTMKKGYVSVNKNLNVEQAIKHIRAEALDADSIYYIYVVDNLQKLVGVLSLRDLFLSSDNSKIEDIMVENVKSVGDNDDREEAVKMVSKYNLVAVPVTDEEGVLKGIITVDDILDVMEEEASEDMYKFAGSSEHERDVAENEKSTLKEQVLSCVRGRISWLLLTAILSFVTAFFFTKFKVIVDDSHIALIFFAPLVLAMGGSVGIQSSAVTIINLLDNEKDVDYQTFMKELISSLINAFVIVVISSIILYFVTQNAQIITAISLTVFINMVLGATFGTLIPIVVNRLESDPSVITSPIISAIMDIIGVIVYYIIISIFIL